MFKRFWERQAALEDEEADKFGLAAQVIGGVPQWLAGTTGEAPTGAAEYAALIDSVVTQV